MSEKMIVCERLSSNADGLQMMAMSASDWAVVEEWLRGRGREPADTVRAMTRREDGSVTFVTGIGYAVIDTDVLGGDGTGRTEEQFAVETGYRFTGSGK